MFRVIADFVDLKDSDKAYHVGDVYAPTVLSPERVNELATSNNKRGIPLIAEEAEEAKEETPEDEKPKRGRKKKS